ncbi:DUF6340 family protein [Bacteroidia bacterium]|nr:DUF6340 family protein [Bacteroidia bacterium]MDB9882970.1 DUF6340 family protein [Bacteroidia bacterium]
MKKYLLILVVILGSCKSTQKISWNTGVTEATVKLPAGASKATLLNRVRIAYPYNNTKSTVLNPNVNEIMNGAINGLRRQIRNQKFLSIFSESSDFKSIANGKFPAALTPSNVSQVGMGSEVLVSLEMLDQAMNDSYTIEIRRENLGNNVYREVDYYVGKRNINLKLGWRLYDVKTGAIIDQWEQQENYFYEAESRERIRATNLLNSNYRTELLNLGTRYGSRYAGRISPTAHLSTREIYSAGNEYLVSGIKAVRTENWEEAEKQWLRGIKKETKTKKLAMLYHNLAMNEDRKGNNPQAREYAKLAANQHPLGIKTQSVVGF